MLRAYCVPGFDPLIPNLYNNPNVVLPMDDANLMVAREHVLCARHHSKCSTLITSSSQQPFVEFTIITPILQIGKPRHS